MPIEPLQFRGVECDLCGNSFDDMDEFKGHVDGDGRTCPGGTPV